MSQQNGYEATGTENTKRLLNNLLLKKGSEVIYKSSFDYISQVAKELRESQSFYLFDLADVLWKVQRWREKLPHIRPFYAVKTNSDPVLLRLFVHLGFSFDCATEGEIRYILNAGGDAKNIIFAHVIKTPGALQFASSVGVDFMTFDSKEEVLKIHKYYPEAKLLLRLTPEDVQCSFDLSDKFGCEAEDAMEVLSLAKSLNLKVIGVSFHVGGLCKNPNSYAATIKTSREVFQLGKKLGFDFKVLDIGGGFTGSKGSDELFDEITQVIKSALEEHFPEPDIEIIAEPGTFFAGSAVSLMTAICGKKKRNIQQKTVNGMNPVQRFYYINDGIYGSFFSGWDQYGCRIKPLLKDSVLQQRPVYSSKIWGQTCCGEDLLVKECQLPDLEEGEFIIWENMGAYNQVLCSTFCGVPLPASKYVFINNPKLSLKWLNNLKEVIDLVSEKCSLVEKE
ncbi:ornithine decarboxylase [Trichonephila clavipes]|nr:ornithine decarboxylase [Trichonephila clavipes]